MKVDGVDSGLFQDARYPHSAGQDGEVFEFSQSALADFVRCEEYHRLRHVAKLRPKADTRAHYLHFGLMVHGMIEAGWRSLQPKRISFNERGDVEAEWPLKAKRTPEEHEAILRKVWKKKRKAIVKESEELAAAAQYMAGDTEVDVEQFLSMPARIEAIWEIYIREWTEIDTPLLPVMVETPFRVHPFAGKDRVLQSGRIDLLTYNPETGVIALWDHKTTSAIPDDAMRIFDFQTISYAHGLVNAGIRVDEIVFNYLLSKPPSPPPIVKGGKPSRDKRWLETTTHDLYLGALTDTNTEIDEPYQEILDRLKERGDRRFTNRHVVPLGTGRSTAIMDNAWAYAHGMWEVHAGKREALHRFTFLCNSCEFKPICTSTVMGGDTDQVIKTQFVRR